MFYESGKITNEFGSKNKKLTDDTLRMLEKINGKKAELFKKKPPLSKEEESFLKDKKNKLNCCPVTFKKMNINFHPSEKEGDKEKEDSKESTNHFISNTCIFL